MINDLRFLAKAALFAIPFLLFALLNSKANLKKKNRCRQYFMPPVAIVYSVVLFILLNKLSGLIDSLWAKAPELLEKFQLMTAADYIRSLYARYAVLLMMALFNTAALLGFIILKILITKTLGKAKIKKDSLRGRLVSLFYDYEEKDDLWYIKPHLGQARTFLKAVYYTGMAVVIIVTLISCLLFDKGLIVSPFYPAFALIIIGELAFFCDGLRRDEAEQERMAMAADQSSRKVLYPLLRKPLRALFGDKLSSEGTTFNDVGYSGASIDDILAGIEAEGGHVGKNYASFIRTRMESGLKPNVDYVRSGYDIAAGHSLLFNTPFYDKLTPYVFYAMSRELLQGGKVLIVLGRHGTTKDLEEWCRRGMMEISNVPNLWRIAELDGTRYEDDEMPDIGIISRSSVHDLEIHRTNLKFLKKVSFVFLVEPSMLVTTAQIGLNLLIKCCGKEKNITFCSVDQNCDGLVDALSHILMTNITEVSATEYPHGVSTYMCWTMDDDYLQHRIVPGVSRYLGFGTELSMVALKNQVQRSVWYGGEAFPVLDTHWIAKQYYYDLLDYAELPTTQETFDKYFQTSFNMCNERTSDYSYVVVEDERNNVFETKRNFATIAEKQGFINVISSEYMLREYMTENTELFNADAKAIPYITADYARTERNAILTLCLKLCVDGVKEKELIRELALMGIGSDEPEEELWLGICSLLGADRDGRHDEAGRPVIVIKSKKKKGDIVFEKESTIEYSRRYSVDTGRFESVYSINNEDFARIILDDLQNAGYVAEQGEDNCYIGTELKGHIYQKYLPGQFFTLNGKYYEMISVTADNRILVRRASEHINGRLSYRQVRRYHISRIADSRSMGALKTVNNIDIYNQFADFTVNTSGYWSMSAYNDFRSGSLVELNGVPEREYYNKQLIKLDFSKLGDVFTDKIRMTLTALFNEVFRTLFADNQPFISAVAPGETELPSTYSLELADEAAASDKCIYIIEDSQLDIGLLIAVERNLNRILQIISDYIIWNDEMIDFSKFAEKMESMKQSDVKNVADAIKKIAENAEGEEKKKKKNIFARFFAWLKSKFKRKKKDKGASEGEGEEKADGQEQSEASAAPSETENTEAVSETEVMQEEPAAEEPAEQEGSEAEEPAKQEESVAEEPEEQEGSETEEPEEQEESEADPDIHEEKKDE